MKQNRSLALYKSALDVIVGGVNSPSRSFRAVGNSTPVFMNRAHGAYFWDEDDNRYIDYLAAFGPIILGHAHPHVTQAIQAAAADGVLYGTPTAKEVHFATMIRGIIPSMQQIRFVNSGTEAVMTTIRLARAYTGRDKIIKFAGCYHGHSDLVLVAAGSGPSTLGIPDSAGIPSSIAQEVITVPFNDIEALRNALKKWQGQIAAVLIEPIVGNFGLVTPKAGFLEEIQILSQQNGALTIFDEVITAFRFHYGAAQDLYNIKPDLTALGKIIGGGLPIGAYGGRREIMDRVAPQGPMYQAGTMAGNPLSITAGIACLEALSIDGIYEKMDQLAQHLTEGIKKLADQYNIQLTINRLGGAFSLHFSEGPIENYIQAQNSCDKTFARFFNALLEQGVYIAPSKYEVWFLTTAHTTADIATTLTAVEESFKHLCISSITS